MHDLMIVVWGGDLVNGQLSESKHFLGNQKSYYIVAVTPWCLV